MTIQCCVCKKVRVDDDWKPFIEPPSVPSSTYCPTCFDRCSQELAIEREAFRQERPRFAATAM